MTDWDGKNGLSSLQQHRNEKSRLSWADFASHRRVVMQLLHEAAAETRRSEPPEESRTPRRACLWGAGNCNDLDLNALAEDFGEIHLIDLDGAALESGITRQGLSQSGNLVLHPGLDITGIFETLTDWRTQQVTVGSGQVPSGHVESCREVARCMQLPIDGRGRFHVAGSLCLLSQLIESVTLALGENHPGFLDLLTDVRRRHLELLVELVRPGGTALLITDIVSSDTFPQLGQIPLDQLPGVVGRLIQERNFFTGLNPFVIRSLFQSEPELAAQVADARLTRPWLWHLGSRTYAVCAIIARRRPGT